MEEQVQVHAHVQIQAATTAVVAERAVLAVLAERMVLVVLAVVVLAVLAVVVLAVLAVPTFKLVGILAAKVAADTSNVGAVNSFLMDRRCMPTWTNV